MPGNRTQVTALGAAAIGVLLLWSSFHGVPASSALRDVISGQKPAEKNTEPISGAGEVAGSGGDSQVKSSPLPGTPSGTGEKANRALGRMLCAAHGWIGAQWDAFDWIAEEESGWNEHAENPNGGAYGIPQALPGSKMASAGADWKNDPATQIRWMIGYIRDRYKTPVRAKAFHEANGYY